MQPLAGIEDVRVGTKVGRIDDEGGPFVLTDRVAEPLSQTGRPMRPIETDDARIMDPLGINQHVRIGLHDLIVGRHHLARHHRRRRG